MANFTVLLPPYCILNEPKDTSGASNTISTHFLSTTASFPARAKSHVSLQVT